MNDSMVYEVKHFTQLHTVTGIKRCFSVYVAEGVRCGHEFHYKYPIHISESLHSGNLMNISLCNLTVTKAAAS